MRRARAPGARAATAGRRPRPGRPPRRSAGLDSWRHRIRFHGVPASTRARPPSASRRGASIQPLQVGRATDLAHVALDGTRATLDVGAWLRGAVATRAGQDGGQSRALGVAEAVGIATEETARRGLRAIDAIAELGH